MILIAGVDEVGRGALAGPVVSAAVILPEKHLVPHLKDSKKLSSIQRFKAYIAIKEHAISIGVACVSPKKIEEINIFWASMLAMKRAIYRLTLKPDRVYLDGKFIPAGLDEYHVEAIIGGDNKIPSISAASIIAKVFRDNLMVRYDKRYSGYSFYKHKGYATALHYNRILKLGPTKLHRNSFCLYKDGALSS